MDKDPEIARLNARLDHIEKGLNSLAAAIGSVYLTFEEVEKANASQNKEGWVAAKQDIIDALIKPKRKLNQSIPFRLRPVEFKFESAEPVFGGSASAAEDLKNFIRGDYIATFGPQQDRILVAKVPYTSPKCSITIDEWLDAFFNGQVEIIGYELPAEMQVYKGE